ncbi:MAG TPA: STAS domain-containing protein [Cellulomonas sp.]
MDVETEHRGEHAVVLRPRGRLTMSGAGELTTLLDSTVAAGRTLVVVDLGEVEFLDSSGLGSLVGGLRAARAAGGDLRIARPGAQARTVLELTTLDHVLHPHAAVEDALGDAG